MHVASERVGQHRIELVGGHRSEKAEPAEVDAQDRNRTLAQAARHAQQGAVAAQYHQKFGARDEIGGCHAGLTAQRCGGFDLHQRGDVARLQPPYQLAPELDGIGAAALDHDADVSHGRTIP